MCGENNNVSDAKSKHNIAKSLNISMTMEDFYNEFGIKTIIRAYPRALIKIIFFIALSWLRKETAYLTYTVIHRDKTTFVYMDSLCTRISRTN